ncbi:MAG: acyltransferase family protein [Arenimonas sp.]
MPVLPVTNASPLERRYDLDWLRILAFGLLIFYHIGMLYVADWGFHYKSQYLSRPLEGLMLLVNMWRMPLLWLISGISIRFVLQKVSAYRFVTARSLRLLLPLLFGILVIIPPQLYVEMTGKGDLHMSYWQFYQIFFDIHNPVFAKYQPGILPHIDVNHLWYLRELWTFSIFILILSPLLNSRFVQAGMDWLANKAGFFGLLLLPMIPMIVISASFQDDKYPMGFIFLLYGYLIGWNVRLWEQIKKYRRIFLVIAAVSYIAILFAYFVVWFDPVLKAMWWAKWLGLITVFDTWPAVLALLGYSAVYLNKPSNKIRYFNDAVLPYYILHQTFIVVLAYWLSPLLLGPVGAALIIIVATFSGCIVSYEIIRRINFLRPLFGLKLQQQKSRENTKLGTFFYRIQTVMAWLLLLPLGLKIML